MIFVIPKFGPRTVAEIVFPASPGALLLHALIKILKDSGKIVKGHGDRPQI